MYVEVAAIAGGAFLGAVVTGSAGFAFAVVATGVWVYVMPPAEVVLLASACATVLHAASVWHFRSEIEYRRLWPFLAGALLGVPLGVLALKRADVDLFRRVVGVLIIVYSLYLILRPGLSRLKIAGRFGTLADGFIGWVSGIVGGLVMMHGVVLIAWSSLRGWDKRRGRFVYQPFILFTGIYVMLIVGVSVQTDPSRMGLYFLACLPALAAGMGVGVKIFRWMSEARFRHLVLVLMLLSGALMLR